MTICDPDTCDERIKSKRSKRIFFLQIPATVKTFYVSKQVIICNKKFTGINHAIIIFFDFFVPLAAKVNVSTTFVNRMPSLLALEIQIFWAHVGFPKKSGSHAWKLHVSLPPSSPTKVILNKFSPWESLNVLWKLLLPNYRLAFVSIEVETCVVKNTKQNRRLNEFNLSASFRFPLKPKPLATRSHPYLNPLAIQLLFIHPMCKP